MMPPILPSPHGIFLEMLEDARKGIINLILVKDLSRLGRDYVEVGHYTDV